MLPLKDNIPTERFPIVTVILIALNVLVFLYEYTLGLPAFEVFVRTYGAIPYEIVNNVDLVPRDFPVVATLLTSIFLHGGILHVAGNMLFLWIFGNNVEDSMGRGRFIVFYLLCGVLASLAQIAVDPSSQIPTVGASGAIAGVLGGYILLYPRARVTTLIFLGIFITFVELPAAVVLLLWIIFQVLAGLAGFLETSADGGVAYFAHIGGFIAGMIAIKFFTLGKNKVHVKRGHMQREWQR